MKSSDLSESCREEFITHARDKGIPLTESQVDLFLRFHEILTTSNRRFNLVSRSDRASILDQILDSLLAQSLIRGIHPQVVLDVGSGGGFPGIPLAILNPHIQFHLLEASYKRASHLVNASRLLSLQNVRTLHDRAENLSSTAFAKCYDLIVARSVAGLRDLVQWSRPLLKARGILAIYAGNQEARRLEELLHPWPCPVRPLLIRSLDIGICPEKPHRLLLIGSFG